MPQFPQKLILILFSVEWINYSIFNTTYIIDLNIMKPPWCIPTHPGLSNNTKSAAGGSRCCYDSEDFNLTKHNKQISTYYDVYSEIHIN
jgi:hypothetical protein